MSLNAGFWLCCGNSRPYIVLRSLNASAESTSVVTQSHRGVFGVIAVVGGVCLVPPVLA